MRSVVHPVLFDSLDAFAGSGARRGLDGVGIAGGVTFRLPAGARSRRNVEGYGSMVAFAVFRLSKLPSPRSRPARGRGFIPLVGGAVPVGCGCVRRIWREAGAGRRTLFHI